ncbi:MAG: ATP-binding protein [Woeseia sp.]
MLFLLLLCALPAAASIAVVDLAQPQSIAGQWQFKLGDDPAWAQPELDDSNWQNTPVPAHSPVDQAGYSGLLWYRITLQLDLTQPSVDETLGALAVSVGEVMSAYELYAGGKKLGVNGRLPPSPEARNDFHKTWEIPASAVGADGQLTLAMRVWRDPSVVARWQTGPYGGDFLIGNVGDLRELAMRKTLLPNVVLGALYLVLGLYHLLIARRNPVLKEFFWFGLLSVALALYTFETSQAKFFIEVPFLWHKKLQFLILYLSPILLGKTLLAVTHTRPNLLIRGLHWLFGLYFLVALVVPGMRILSQTLLSFQLLGLAWALVLAGTMAWRAYHGSRSARAIVVILLLIAAAIINDELLPTAVVGSGNVLYIVFALMMFFMALMMAERYTDILQQMESAVRRRTQELTAANQNLVAAAQTKGNFLANMSHEMRTPMNAILGLTRLGLQTELSEQQRDYFGKVEQSAEGLQDIIDSILDFSKLEEGELECVIEPFNPAEVVEGIRRVWEEPVQEAGLTLNIEVDQKIPDALLGDAKRLKQVLSIFISNAVKFTEQGRVDLAISLQDTEASAIRLRFAVSDTGPGIADDVRETLFEAFSQADNSMTRKHGGTGLGLSIAQRLVELMGGNVEVASTLGEGSTFSFELALPLADEAVATEESDAELDLTPIRGARVLLVDDSDLNLQVAGELLKQAKLYVEIARDGRQAVEKATSMPFDCVLMDVQMPVMDGYTATERIRSKPHLKDLPVLAMTANAMQQDRARGAEAGMNAYIPKPIEPAELYRALLQWIEPGERDYDAERFARPESSAESAAELPDNLPGINVKDGLKRVAGNTTLYISLLKDFCKDYADAPQRIKAFLDSGNTDQARQLAHKLRGIANNLGADETGAAAEAIELTIKSGADVSTDALSRLVAANNEVSESQALLAPLLAGAEEGVELDDTQRRKLFSRVVEATGQSNPEALDLVEELLNGMSDDADGYVELTAAKDALDMYDFSGAGEHLNAAAATASFS